MSDLGSRSQAAVGLVLLLAVLACGPCGWLTEPEPRQPDRPLQITEDAALTFEEKLLGSWEAQREDQFLLQFTDDELTSYLNLKLQDTDLVPISEPRVWLTRGKIYVSGRLNMPQLPLSGQAVIVTSARVVDERIQMTIDQATIGRVPIPRAVLRSLEDTVNGALSQAQMDVRVLQLELLEGEAIVAAGPR
jgi:hypothetical protein